MIHGVMFDLNSGFWMKVRLVGLKDTVAVIVIQDVVVRCCGFDCDCCPN